MNWIAETKKNFLFSMGSFTRNSDLLFPLHKLRPSLKNDIVSQESTICIEGFQRSGNTYFKELFLQANPNAKLAKHFHGVAQVRRAIELNIPTVVLIREPKDAIASLITYDEDLSYNVAIDAYVNYYSSLQKVRGDYLLIKFKDLISDFNHQIEKINGLFHTNFSGSNLSKSEEKNLLAFRQRKYENEKSMPFPNDYKRLRNDIHMKEIVVNVKYSKVENIYKTILRNNIFTY